MTTKQPIADSQTTAQRDAQNASRRQRDAGKRVFNNLLGFWMACARSRCRRRRACSDDPHACFQRLWPSVPEEEREYVRACIKAARTTRSPKEMHQAGVAARDACLKRQEEMAAASAAQRRAQPVQQARSEPEVRVRRL